MLYLGVLGYNLQKQEFLNLGPKMHYLDILGFNFEKLLSYLKSVPSNLSNCKVSCKNKNAKMWNQKCLILIFFGWNLKILFSYLKSASSNLCNCKISCKNKNP